MQNEVGGVGGRPATDDQPTRLSCSVIDREKKNSIPNNNNKSLAGPGCPESPALGGTFRLDSIQAEVCLPVVSAHGQISLPNKKKTQQVPTKKKTQQKKDPKGLGVRG